MSIVSNKQITVESPDNPEDSPAVIAYRLRQVEGAVKDGFREHNEKLDNLVTNFATKTDIQSLSHRVSSLEADRRWLVRLVIGAVVFALLALIGVGFKLNK